MKIRPNDKVKIPGYAVQKSLSMPAHPKGKTASVAGESSNFCKHPSGTMAADVDYRMLKLTEQVMSKKDLEREVAKIVASSPTFGSRGGKRSDINAKRIISQMIKEGLVIPA